jgi:GNAT superfamily N-acetyltransferase
MARTDHRHDRSVTRPIGATTDPARTDHPARGECALNAQPNPDPAAAALAASPAIRAAVPSDAERVAALHADSWRRHYRGAYSDSYLDGDVVADRRAVWTPRLAAAPATATAATATAPATPTTATFVAEEDGGLVGFVHVVFDEDARWGSLVDNLHVVAGRQRGGWGTALLGRAARAVATRAETDRMYLWVLEQNVAAQGFYAARGGEIVESALVGAPGGDPSRLNGTPAKLRIAWPDTAALVSFDES